MKVLRRMQMHFFQWVFKSLAANGSRQFTDVTLGVGRYCKLLKQELTKRLKYVVGQGVASKIGFEDLLNEIWDLHKEGLKSYYFETRKNKMHRK